MIEIQVVTVLASRLLVPYLLEDKLLLDQVGVMLVDLNGLQLEDPRSTAQTDNSRSISLGLTQEDLDDAVRHGSSIHFHLGDMDAVGTKFITVVPLSGQGIVGARNVLRLLFDSDAHLQMTQHADLVDFARRAKVTFSASDAALRSFRAAEKLASDLYQEIPSLSLVLGCGFPFYLTGTKNHPDSKVPESIRTYLRVQARSFRRKLVSADEAYATEVYLRQELSERGFELDRNVYDLYEFERENVVPPERGPTSGSLLDFVRANELDIAESIWPCQPCTSLQDQEAYPNQMVLKDFSQTCLSCRQTTLIPRNVTGLTNDIDLLLVISGTEAEVQAASRSVIQYIDKHPVYYRYDTDTPAMIRANIGPVDAFISSQDNFLRALDDLDRSGEAWTEVGLVAEALWLPPQRHEMSFGLDFVMTHWPFLPSAPTMGDRLLRAQELAERLKKSRVAFSYNHDPHVVAKKLRKSSFYMRQLMSNDTIQQALVQRLNSWKEASSWSM